MSHVRIADWAANVPFSGILNPPAGLGQTTDIGQLTGAGFSIDDIPKWNGTKFVPSSETPGGGSGAIANLDSPAVATKRINPSTGETEQVWLREVFDVRQYGADNTGGINATGAFNSAITALNANGGGALIIPAGRYTIAGTLNRILGRCWVHGDGMGSTILSFAGDAWWVTSGSFFGCTGMTLNGSGAAGTGIKIMDVSTRDNFLLRDLRISGFGFAISVDTPNRGGWIDSVRLDALELALSVNTSDSFVRGVSIYNGGDNTKNAFEMTGYRNQVSDFKLLGDSAHFLKGLFVNDGGNHIISGGIIIGCDEEAISLSNGTGGVSGCRVQNISWLDIGTDPDVVSYDAATNWVSELYEIGTGTPFLTIDQVVVGNGNAGEKILPAGTDTDVLTMVAGIPAWAPPTGGGGGGTKTLKQWSALDNQPPASNYATFNTRNAIALLEFDAAADEAAIFIGFIPEGADFTTGISVRISCAAASAASGDYVLTTSFEKCDGDLDTDSFATGVSATTTTNGNNGTPTTTVIDHSSSEIDGLVAGDMFRLRVVRTGTDGADTMTGDLQLFTVEIQQR